MNPRMIWGSRFEVVVRKGQIRYPKIKTNLELKSVIWDLESEILIFL